MHSQVKVVPKVPGRCSPHWPSSRPAPNRERRLLRGMAGNGGLNHGIVVLIAITVINTFAMLAAP